MHIYEVVEFIKPEFHTEVYKIKNIKTGFEMECHDDTMTLKSRTRQ